MASYQFLCFLLTSVLLSLVSPSYSSSRDSVARTPDSPIHVSSSRDSDAREPAPPIHVYSSRYSDSREPAPPIHTSSRYCVAREAPPTHASSSRHSVASGPVPLIHPYSLRYSVAREAPPIQASSSRYSVAAEPFPPIHASESVTSLRAKRVPTRSEKVELALYYESLCPYCQNFIKGNLTMAVDTDLKSILELKMVPWGNAIIQDGSIFCQHGEEECYLNIIHACSIHLWPDVRTHYNLIKCIEKGSSGIPLQNEDAQVWKDCATQQGLAVKSIQDCYDSGLGKKRYEEYVKYVCKAYKGKRLPKTCNSHSSYSKKAKAVSVKGAELHQKKTEPSA